MVEVKAHRGEPLNERADTKAENARQLPSECRQWTTRTQRMTYEWSDNDGVKHVTAWSRAVRNAMLRGGAEFQRQKGIELRTVGTEPSCAPRTLDYKELGKRLAHEPKVT